MQTSPSLNIREFINQHPLSRNQWVLIALCFCIVAVDGMDEKVLDELQDTIDEKLGRGYQLHSFVDPSNTNVREVQFVYVVDGVKSADDTSSSSDDQSQQASDDEQQDQSFMGRLAALFTSSDKNE